MESFFSKIFGKKDNSVSSASVAKARLSVVVASTPDTDSALVRELEQRVRKVVHDFYIEKNLCNDDDDVIEDLNYSYDETGIMEVLIPIKSK